MTQAKPITVTSHVARDFLQNAAFFNTLPKVVWEYVSNSLDNAARGQTVNVAVDLYGGDVTISDDATGMSRTELNNFFKMHGVNVQRKRGKRVRGRFGTGKCAAFGVANKLEIDTTKGGKRNVVALHREDIMAADSGEAFPVQDVRANEKTDQTNGTIVSITELNIPRLDVEGSITYVARHLKRYRHTARVLINGLQCVHQDRQAKETIRCKTPPEVAQTIGADVELLIKVSPVPLETENIGIDILSHGIWHETTLAGLEDKDMSQFLFGEVDVPALEDNEAKIPAFDNTRNNTLNKANPYVVVLLAWMAQELEKVRKTLVEEERNRRRSQEAQHLEEEASRIADILNKDFDELRKELELARRISGRRGNVDLSGASDPNLEPLPGEGSEITEWQPSGNPHGDGQSSGGLVGPGDTPRSEGPDLIPGSELGSRKSGANRTRGRRKGLFSIAYRNESGDQYRSRYETDTRTIVINLDHPQIDGAYRSSGMNTDTRQFREISYEVAAVEYSLAIPFDRVEQEGELYQAYDALFDVRDTINRVSRKFSEVLNKSSSD